MICYTAKVEKNIAVDSRCESVNPAEEKMVSIDVYLRLFLLEKVFFF